MTDHSTDNIITTITFETARAAQGSIEARSKQPRKALISTASTIALFRGRDNNFNSDNSKLNLIKTEDSHHLNQHGMPWASTQQPTLFKERKEGRWGFPPFLGFTLNWQGDRKKKTYPLQASCLHAAALLPRSLLLPPFLPPPASLARSLLAESEWGSERARERRERPPPSLTSTRPDPLIPRKGHPARDYFSLGQRNTCDIHI